MSSQCRLDVAVPGVTNFLDAVVRAAEGLQVDPKEVKTGCTAVYIQALLTVFFQQPFSSM